jgi:hypothetical protein
MTHDEYRDQLANGILLPGESKKSLLFYLDRFEETFLPRTLLEQFLIGDMTTQYWRKLRASCLEQIVFQQLMRDQAEMLPGHGQAANAANACKTMAIAPNAIEMLGRWQTRYQRLLRDNIRLFFEIRKELAASPDAQQAAPDPRASIYTSPLTRRNDPENLENDGENDGEANYAAPETTPDPNNGVPESC